MLSWQGLFCTEAPSYLAILSLKNFRRFWSTLLSLLVSVLTKSIDLFPQSLSSASLVVLQHMSEDSRISNWLNLSTKAVWGPLRRLRRDVMMKRCLWRNFCRSISFSSLNFDLSRIWWYFWDSRHLKQQQLIMKNPIRGIFLNDKNSILILSNKLSSSFSSWLWTCESTLLFFNKFDGLPCL